MMVACPRKCGNVIGEPCRVMDEDGVHVSWHYWKFVCRICGLKWYSL